MSTRSEQIPVIRSPAIQVHAFLSIPLWDHFSSIPRRGSLGGTSGRTSSDPTLSPRIRRNPKEKEADHCHHQILMQLPGFDNAERVVLHELTFVLFPFVLRQTSKRVFCLISVVQHPRFRFRVLWLRGFFSVGNGAERRGGKATYAVWTTTKRFPRQL